MWGQGGCERRIEVCLFVCLFVLMLYVPVNSYGHVGTSPPISWDFYPALKLQKKMRGVGRGGGSGGGDQGRCERKSEVCEN